MKSDSLEETVQDLWEAIVNTYFPWDENYRNKSKGTNQQNNTAPDVKMIQIMAKYANTNPRVAGDWAERQILQVECKRPSLDNARYGWDDVITGQFLDDLFMNLNASKRTYGVVAIGKKGKFFRFDGKKAAAEPDALVALYSGKIDLGDETQFPQFAYWMDYIKRNGYQWAY
ncbi:hypothetical protein BJX76DRAFT_366341 [Aspergillus varians]